MEKWRLQYAFITLSHALASFSEDIYIFFFSLFDVTNIIYVIRQKEDVYLQYVSFSRQASVEANVLLKTLGSSFCLCAWGSASSHFFLLKLKKSSALFIGHVCLFFDYISNAKDKKNFDNTFTKWLEVKSSSDYWM